jgi:hypothetical protein
LWFKRYAVRFAALIANDFKPFPLCAAATAAALALAAEVRAPRITAGLAPLRMGQAAFAIIILLSFSKRKRASTLGTSDI